MRKLKVVATSPLPPLYAAWMDELLDGPIPAETEATCDDCAMCKPGELAFDPRIKCCTYLPELPNFLVGRILEDRDRAARKGRASIEARIDEKIAVTPLGLGAPARYSLLYAHAGKHDGFGRTPSLLCPHYDAESGGKCGVWKNRMSTCATWFCRHVRGAVGLDFWRRGVHPLLVAVETSLSRWCVLELDPGTEALLRLFPLRTRQDPTSTSEGGQLQHDPDVYARDWGRFLDRERELYIESARLVSKLSWKDVMRIGGVDVRARAQIVRALHDRLGNEEIPPVLRPGTFEVVEMHPEVTRVSTYSRFDPVDLPSQLVSLLGRFDGRPTRAVLADIVESDGIEFSRGLLKRLVDFEVLVTPEAPPRTRPT